MSVAHEVHEPNFTTGWQNLCEIPKNQHILLRGKVTFLFPGPRSSGYCEPCPHVQHRNKVRIDHSKHSKNAQPAHSRARVHKIN